jgi:hypothetical protein
MVSFRISGLRRFHARAFADGSTRGTRHHCAFKLCPFGILYASTADSDVQSQEHGISFAHAGRLVNRLSMCDRPRALPRLKTDVTYIRHPSALNRKALPLVALPSSYSTRRGWRTCCHATCYPCINRDRVAYTGDCCRCIPSVYPIDV